MTAQATTYKFNFDTNIWTADTTPTAVSTTGVSISAFSRRIAIAVGPQVDIIYLNGSNAWQVLNNENKFPPFSMDGRPRVSNDTMLRTGNTINKCATLSEDTFVLLTNTSATKNTIETFGYISNVNRCVKIADDFICSTYLVDPKIVVVNSTTIVILGKKNPTEVEWIIRRLEYNETKNQWVDAGSVLYNNIIFSAVALNDLDLLICRRIADGSRKLSIYRLNPTTLKYVFLLNYERTEKIEAMVLMNPGVYPSNMAITYMNTDTTPKPVLEMITLS